MSTLTASVPSLGSVLKVKHKISRKHLSKYSWLPDVLRLEGSITTRILGPVLTVTIFASVVTYAWRRGYNVTLTNSVTPLLAVVVGLILVFRNGTSYDRYYEGRKDFAAMTSNIRNISRLFWINVSLSPDDSVQAMNKGKTPGSYLTADQLTRKKIKVIKLCLSFAYAAKHHLRDEPGLDFEDYSDVLPPSFARFDEVGFDRTYTPPEQSYASIGTVDSHSKKNSKRSHIRIQDSAATLPVSTTPLLRDNHRSVEFRAFAEKKTLPLPLIIAHSITRTIFKFRRDGYLETVGPAGVNAMNQLVQGMVDQLTSMERIVTTPIPVSYGIHLKQCVTLYLFALPFTLVKELDWRMIPIVTVVAFTLMGIEGIANEIEMPFGKDDTDLPLDQYCEQLKDEIFYMMERLPQGGQGGYGVDDGDGDD